MKFSQNTYNTLANKVSLKTYLALHYESILFILSR